MITKLKKTIALINGCLIFLSILIFSINANAKISDSASIYLISKLLKKVNTPNHDIYYKYPPEVEEYQFVMQVLDPKDCYFEKRINKSCDSYNCRFSIFKDGATKIEYYNNFFEDVISNPEEKFLDSVNKNSNEFKQSLKKLIRNIEFTDNGATYSENFVTFEPEINIKSNGENNFSKITVTNHGGIL